MLFLLVSTFLEFGERDRKREDQPANKLEPKIHQFAHLFEGGFNELFNRISRIRTFRHDVNLQRDLFSLRSRD